MFENLTFMQFLLLYLVLQIVYVILNTVTNIAKIKYSKLIASITSAVCYGFYVIVVVATASNQSIWVKMLLTAVTNIVGVYIGMWVMEKLRKDKLWKIEATIPTKYIETVDYNLDNHFVPHSYVKLSDKHTVFYCYCATQNDSKIVKKILDNYEARYFVSESKNLY